MKVRRDPEKIFLPLCLCFMPFEVEGNDKRSGERCIEANVGSSNDVQMQVNELKQKILKLHECEVELNGEGLKHCKEACLIGILKEELYLILWDINGTFDYLKQ